jgi:hypothetical protein
MIYRLSTIIIDVIVRMNFSTLFDKPKIFMLYTLSAGMGVVAASNLMGYDKVLFRGGE